MVVPQEIDITWQAGCLTDQPDSQVTLARRLSRRVQRRDWYLPRSPEKHFVRISTMVCRRALYRIPVAVVANPNGWSMVEGQPYRLSGERPVFFCVAVQLSTVGRSNPALERL